MAKTTTVFSKTYTNGIFISVIIGGYGTDNSPFEVLIEKDNIPHILNLDINTLVPSSGSNGWVTFGDVQEIINHLEQLEKTHAEN